MLLKQSYQFDQIDDCCCLLRSNRMVNGFGRMSLPMLYLAKIQQIRWRQGSEIANVMIPSSEEYDNETYQPMHYSFFSKLHGLGCVSLLVADLQAHSYRDRSKNEHSIVRFKSKLTSPRQVLSNAIPLSSPDQLSTTRQLMFSIVSTLKARSLWLTHFGRIFNPNVKIPIRNHET